MSNNLNPAQCANTAAIRRLERLRDLVVNLRILDIHSDDLKLTPITESLKLMQQVFMGSNTVEIMGSDERATVNDHFWIFFETATYIEHFPHPKNIKSDLLSDIEKLIEFISNQQTKMEELG